MKPLLLFLSFTLGSTTVASAEDYFLNCGGGSLFMFKEGWFSNQIYFRYQGGWEEWCTDHYETFTIKEKGGVCKIKGDVRINNNDGMPFITVAGVQTLDFITGLFTSHFKGHTRDEKICGTGNPLE